MDGIRFCWNPEASKDKQDIIIDGLAIKMQTVAVFLAARMRMEGGMAPVGCYN